LVTRSRSTAWSTARRLAVITAAWCCFATLLTINNYVYSSMMGQPVSWREAAHFPLVTYAIWTVFTPAVLAFCARFRRLRLWGPLWFLGHAVFALIVLMLIAACWMPFADPDPAAAVVLSWHMLNIMFWQNFAWNSWMYWALVGIFYGLDYYFGARDARVRAAQLESQLAKAELDVLKSQLQPHFLFNTLNLVSSLIYTDVESADDMIGDLGALLRLSLESQTTHEVALVDEMKAVEIYLNIQRVRFQDTLTVDIDIDPATLRARVPHLILQPLIENAFRHGISKRVGSGVLKIEANKRNDSLNLRVSDNGPGLQAHADNAGIGLSNTRARLDRLYSEHASLNITTSPAGYCVELCFPFAPVSV
jgi:two-component system LytT family sensor kinase